METHPTKIIQTEKGNIVLSMPDNARLSALSNSIFTYLMSDDDLKKMDELSAEERDAFIVLKCRKRGYTFTQLTLLAYVQSAPFHLNDYFTDPIMDLKSFLEIADSELIGKMSKAVEELGLIDPLHP